MSVDKQQVQKNKDRPNRSWKRLWALFICLLACGLYFFFVVDRAFVEIELDVAKKTDFKIYWAGPGQSYSESRMSMASAKPGKKEYSFFLSSIGRIDRLRIDTHSYKGEVTLKRLLLQQEGWGAINLSTPEDLGKLAPLAQIADFRVDDTGLWVKSSGIDPNFELTVTPDYLGLDYGWLLLRLAVIAFIFFLIPFCAGPLAKDLRFVPVLLFGVWILIIVMASVSKRNVHPDEYVHMYATQYYQDNWLPPVLEDPAIDNTYSVYGVSRLNSREIYYLFAGKFDKFLQTFNLPETLSLRMLSVFLFGLIFLYTVKNKYARMVALPFLVSPQIWYVFSYCASDGFALFFAYILACELVDPDSLLHRYLKGDRWRDRIGGLVVLSVLLGIVFLLKKNYYPFIAFFYLCLGVKLFLVQEFYWERKEAILRLLLITFLGLAIFGLRVGADYMVNGPDRREKIVSIQEEKALSWYKPSTELSKKHVYLRLKERGVTLEDMVTKYRWFERSFRSSFGVFGYFTISASPSYYNLVRWTGAALLIFVVGSVLLRGGLIGSGLAVTVVGLSAALIGASLHHSWTADLQAQGRYLFPIIPMLGILYGWKHAVVNKQVLILGVSSMYLLGVYCFVFEALLRIPKTAL